MPKRLFSVLYRFSCYVLQYFSSAKSNVLCSIGNLQLEYSLSSLVNDFFPFLQLSDPKIFLSEAKKNPISFFLKTYRMYLKLIRLLFFVTNYDAQDPKKYSTGLFEDQVDIFLSLTNKTKCFLKFQIISNNWPIDSLFFCFLKRMHIILNKNWYLPFKIVMFLSLNNDQQLSSSRTKAQLSEFFEDLNRIKTYQNK